MLEYIHLDDSILFDTYCVSEINGFIDLTEYILDEIGLRNDKSRDYYKKRDFLRNMLANLYISERINRPVAISKDRNSWKCVERYHKLFMTYRTMKFVFDRMTSAKLIVSYKGFNIPKTSFSYNTRFHATSKLENLINRFVPTLEFIPAELDQDYILLKDQKKFLSGYEDDENTVEMRRQLTDYNEFMSDQEISISLDHILEPLSKTIREYQLKGFLTIPNSNYNTNSPTPSNLTPYPLHTITQNVHYNEQEAWLLGLKQVRSSRIFNTDFSHGGRFYHSIHLVFGKEQRKEIRINGERTCELDYSSLHPRMLYNMSGIAFEGDCYSDISDSQEERELVKEVMLTMINISKEKKDKLPASVNKEIKKHNSRQKFLPVGQRIYKKGIPYKKVWEYADRIEKYHSPIAEYFNSGIGLRLQNLDSHIMSNVLNDCYREKVASLPVHDSCIVKERDKDFLYSSMVRNYQKVMNGYTPVIK
ncbi:MAG: hypothetical protein CVU57_16125 [Deltaproteobacteria bacterium HGW-Deltaproteobacteria-15]|nr:MAG: hypothetical protein CVU57_16125 [Deltaproteobacteria bacterium HGW-Deltaproteobacteria-15]